MQLQIHRGTREIGGSCIELAAGESRILLDLGLPLVDRDGAPFDQKIPRDADGPNLVECGVLPNVRGLYPWDEGVAPVDGVFISHAHLDHYGLASYVRPDAPIYMSNDTLCLLEITEQFTGHAVPKGEIRTFEAGDSITCGSFAIVPFLVDHSAHGAVAFEVEAEGKRIFYTGDFRDHGRKAKTIKYLKHHVAPEMDALLLEGTMLGREAEEVMTEDQLEHKAADLMRNCSKAVFVCQSGQNIDRLVSFYRAAIRADRLFAVDVYAANVLQKLCATRPGSGLPNPSPAFDKLRVFFPRRLTDRLVKNGHKETLVLPFGRYRISRPEIKAHPERVAMLVRPSMGSDFESLGDLRDSLLIYSMWQGYLKDAGTKDFLTGLQEQGVRVEHLHTSGHASVKALGELVTALRPKRLIPIHTLEPEKYKRFASQALVLSDGQPLTV